MINKCAICGTKENLEAVENVYVTTTGYNIPIKKGYLCGKCKNERMVRD